MAKVLKITLVRSMIGRSQHQRRVLRGMGLTRLHQSVELADTPAVRGMVQKVCHLVKAEERVV